MTPTQKWKQVPRHGERAGVSNDLLSRHFPIEVVLPSERGGQSRKTGVPSLAKTFFSFLVEQPLIIGFSSRFLISWVRISMNSVHC